MKTPQNTPPEGVRSSAKLGADDGHEAGGLLWRLGFCRFRLQRFYFFGMAHPNRSCLLSVCRLQRRKLRLQADKLLLPLKGFLFRRKVARLNRLVERLYLLDQSRSVAVLHAFNQFGKQGANFGYDSEGGFYGHNGNGHDGAPNGSKLSDGG